MSPTANRVGHRDLGVSSSDTGIEAALYEDGEVLIEATPFGGGWTTSLVLEREQALALVAWLANRDEIVHAG